MRLINIFYSVANGLELKLVYQDGNKKVVKTIQPNLLPYFYTTIDVEDDRIVSKELIETHQGRFWKNYVTVPYFVRDLREELKMKGIKTFEADIPYARRWFLDNNVSVGNEPLTKVYFDIEAENPGTRFVDFEKDKIKSIAWVTSDGKKGCIHIKDVKGNERELIMQFFNQIRNYSCLIGWNSDNFDIPYLIERCRYNRIPISWLKYFVKLDLMDLYKRFVTSYSKTTIVTSFSLDNVASIELGEHKIDKKSLWEGSVEEQKRYNLRDAELTAKIDQKLKLTDLIDSFSRLMNLLPGDCVRFSTIIEYSVIRELHGKYIFNNRNRDAEDSSYMGALVLQPPVGIIEGVAVFDFSSMYPNIIRAFKISLDEEGEVYPKLISRLMELRKKYKDIYKKTRDETYNVLQIATKFLLASFYGVLGFTKSRIYDRKLAETITTRGRELISGVAKLAESNGYKPIYGDTDSVMIQIPFENSFEFERKINDFLKEKYKTKHLHVKFEKYFSKIYFYGKKKRYVGRLVWDEGADVDKLHARGLEIRRTDWCKLATEYERELVSKMLNNLQDAICFHRRFVQNIREQPIEKFVIYKSITRPIEEYKTKPPHIRALEKNSNHETVWVGSKIGYIVTRWEDKKIKDVDMWGENKEIEPDYNYYINKQIKPIFNRLLHPLLQKSLLSYIQ